MRIRIGDAELEVSGPSDFVDQKIKEFVDQIKAGLSKASEATPKMPSTGDAVAKEKLSESQFFRRLSTKSEVDRVLAGGYYLENYQNVENFTAAEIRDIIRNAKMPPPRNVNDAVNRNIRKGLIMSAGDKDGKMAFVLTTDGEEKVRELLAQN